jgi:hypothetical protein
MVGVPGDRVSNMSPPTLALLGHAVWLAGLVLVLRHPVSRWLQRPRVWTSVVAANGLAMTAFLWHLTAMFTATALTAGLGLAQPAVGSATWWLLRPLWFAVLVLLTGGLVLAFRRADRPRPASVPAPGEHAAWRSAVAGSGATLCIVGILGLSAVGFGGLLASRTATLVVLPVTPLLSACALAAGAAILFGTRPRNAPPPHVVGGASQPGALQVHAGSVVAVGVLPGPVALGEEALAAKLTVQPVVELVGEPGHDLYRQH